MRKSVMIMFSLSADFPENIGLGTSVTAEVARPFYSTYKAVDGLISTKDASWGHAVVTALMNEPFLSVVLDGVELVGTVLVCLARKCYHARVLCLRACTSA